MSQLCVSIAASTPARENKLCELSDGNKEKKVTENVEHNCTQQQKSKLDQHFISSSVSMAENNQSWHTSDELAQVW